MGPVGGRYTWWIDNIEFQSPSSRDGIAVNRLVALSPPLDTNSIYCNLLQCSHFAETSVIAKCKGDCAGFISAYRIPSRPDTLFVWQVVVASTARGKGLASRMLQELLARPACRGVQYLETTITRSNAASWALFRKLAGALEAPLEESIGFDETADFCGQHNTEHLVRIGPFSLNSKN